MLFKAVHLEGIKAGKITLAFRKWQKPSVKVGTLLHTAIGLVEIKNMEVIEEKYITNEDAIHAGFKHREEVLKSLSAKTKGETFRIMVSFYSEDPRINLREQAALSDQEVEDLLKKLDRLDQFGKEGAWTKKVMEIIKEKPNLHAVGIARLSGFQKEWLKINVRKLKNLGLTISHPVGYELSPRGKVLLEKMSRSK